MAVPTRSKTSAWLSGMSMLTTSVIAKTVCRVCLSSGVGVDEARACLASPPLSHLHEKAIEANGRAVMPAPKPMDPDPKGALMPWNWYQTAYLLY